MTHRAIIAPLLAALVLGASSQAAFAGSAADAVRAMTEALYPAPTAPIEKQAFPDDVDMTTTASIRSADKFDARGVVKAHAEVTFGAGVVAPIAKMQFRAGDTFAKGDLLFAFNCARQEADLRGARASQFKAQSYFEGKERLKARGAAGGQEVAEARSDAVTARAKSEALQAVVDLCTMEAPFDGRVVERHVEEYEIPAANAPVLTVVDATKMELDLIVPSNWLRWVKDGTTFDFSVDELGNTFKAKVARMGAKVDAVSQTITLTGAFTGNPERVLAGMSGTAKFAEPARQ